MVPVIIVEVMPKPELLDPQGKAVAGALQRLGASGIDEVRLGKRFEVTVHKVTADVLVEVTRFANDIFCNSVIEDVVSITVATESGILPA